ncbi:hypothetical protein SCARD494_12362 [Seiridium cardinale]
MHQRKKVEGGKKDIATEKESILSQVKQGILIAIDNTHKALEKGVNSALDAVEREKEAWGKRLSRGLGEAGCCVQEATRVD